MSRPRVQPDVVRMLTLVPWLLARPGASLEETAAMFAVDVPTVRAELEHLDFCGLPGLGGGALFDITIVGDRVTVRMADELRYPLRPSPVEALRLLLIVRTAQRFVGSEVPALRSASAKLHRALGVPEGAVEVLDPESNTDVEVLRSAIADRVRVRFEYRGRGDLTHAVRVVEPWALAFHEGAWYLHGFDTDAEAVRVFRLDRAADVAITGDPAEWPPLDVLDPPAYVPQPGDLEVELRLEPQSLWLLDAVAADDVTPSTAGGCQVRLRTASPDWLARLVLMAGGGAEVVSPLELRKQVRSLAQEALARLR